MDTETMVGLRKAVAELAQRQRAVKALQIDFRTRRNDARVTTADVVEYLPDGHGAAVGRHDARIGLQALCGLGCGRYFVGRRSRKTRLEWSVSPQELFGGDFAAEAAQPDRPMEAAVSKAAHVPGEEPAFDFVFPLRQDFSVTLRLPRSFTVGERQRLATAITALPTVDL